MRCVLCDVTKKLRVHIAYLLTEREEHVEVVTLRKIGCQDQRSNLNHNVFLRIFFLPL